MARRRLSLRELRPEPEADEEAELPRNGPRDGHVCAHHAVREQTRLNYAQLGTIPLISLRLDRYGLRGGLDRRAHHLHALLRASSKRRPILGVMY